MDNRLVGLILLKIEEQIERTEHLISLIPAGMIAWRPEAPAVENPPVDLGHLLGHLLECLAGFCAVLYALNPERLAHFGDLRKHGLNQDCVPADAVQQIHSYGRHIHEGFSLLTDEDLSRTVPTIFSARGVAGMSLILNNLEHLVNHKHQLFWYLKMLGVAVTSRDLYHFDTVLKGVTV